MAPYQAWHPCIFLGGIWSYRAKWMQLPLQLLEAPNLVQRPTKRSQNSLARLHVDILVVVDLRLRQSQNFFWSLWVNCNRRNVNELFVAVYAHDLRTWTLVNATRNINNTLHQEKTIHFMHVLSWMVGNKRDSLTFLWKNMSVQNKAACHVIPLGHNPKP